MLCSALNLLASSSIALPSLRKSRKAANIARMGGGGPQLLSTAFEAVFPNITKAILNDENSTKSQNLPPKSDHLIPKFMNFY